MKSTVVVDTGIIVEYLKTGKGSLPSVYEKYNMIISVATFVEILASKTFEDESLKKEVLSFIDKYFKVRETSQKMGSKAAELIREKGISLAEALTAATALDGAYPVLTDDEKTFGDIPGIELMKL